MSLLNITFEEIESDTDPLEHVYRFLDGKSPTSEQGTINSGNPVVHGDLVVRGIVDNWEDGEALYLLLDSDTLWEYGTTSLVEVRARIEALLPSITINDNTYFISDATISWMTFTPPGDDWGVKVLFSGLSGAVIDSEGPYDISLDEREPLPGYDNTPHMCFTGNKELRAN